MEDLSKIAEATLKAGTPKFDTPTATDVCAVTNVAPLAEREQASSYDVARAILEREQLDEGIKAAKRALLSKSTARAMLQDEGLKLWQEMFSDNWESSLKLALHSFVNGLGDDVESEDKSAVRDIIRNMPLHELEVVKHNVVEIGQPKGKNRKPRMEGADSRANAAVSENLNEAPKKYREVVFLQGEAADEVLDILDRRGVKAAADLLSQMDFGEGFWEDHPPWATGDQNRKVGKYVLSWSERHGYIGITEVR